MLIRIFYKKSVNFLLAGRVLKELFKDFFGILSKPQIIKDLVKLSASVEEMRKMNLIVSGKGCISLSSNM